MSSKVLIRFTNSIQCYIILIINIIIRVCLNCVKISIKWPYSGCFSEKEIKKCDLSKESFIYLDVAEEPDNCYVEFYDLIKNFIQIWQRISTKKYECVTNIFWFTQFKMYHSLFPIFFINTFRYNAFLFFKDEFDLEYCFILQEKLIPDRSYVKVKARCGEMFWEPYQFWSVKKQKDASNA